MKSLHSKNWLLLFIIIAVILLLVFFNGRGLLSGVKNIFFKAASPFLNFFQNISNKISDFCQSFLRAKDLKKESEMLKIENSELKSQLAELKELERENEILREQFKLVTSHNQIFAQIRGFSPEKTSILINQGENAGLGKDFPVVARGNIIIGKIFEVYPNFSKVLLINDLQSQVAAMTQDGRAKGILKGGGTKNYLVLEMVAREEEIKVGDKVITSGLDNVFPKGFLIGEIAEVIKDDLEIFQKAKVRPHVEFDDLEEVFVLIEAEQR